MAGSAVMTTSASRAVMKKATDVSASAQPADLVSCIFPTSGDRAAAPPGACRLPELPVLRTRGARIRQLSKRKFTAHAGLVIPAEVQCSGRKFSALAGTSVLCPEPQWSRWNLSLLFNLSCPVWHARCARWQCSDTWNCVRARYFVKDEDGYPSRACRRATSGESVTNARRPRPRVFLERTGRWPLPPAGDPRICSASGCRSPAAHAAPGTRPGREAWLLPRPADHAARRPGLPAPASAPGGAGRAWYPLTAP